MDLRIVAPKDNLNRPPESQAPVARHLPQVEIVIKHPGYQEAENVLMLLRGFDRVGEREGLHHGTVLTACHIVSGRNDGYLTAEREGAPIELHLDYVLHEGEYYFIVPNDHCYAVFPSFEHWTFPHDSLPSTWTELRKPRAAPLTLMPAQSCTAQAILDRDPSCLLSGMRDIRERAHICPREESRWFQANGMRRYNLNRLLTADARIDDMSNAIAMRSDVHKAYDKRLFVMVPKRNRWTVHFMEPTFDLGSLYHNMPLNLHTDVSLEHMFSRFAWTIFPLIREFLEQGPLRQVRTQVINGGVPRGFNGNAISKTFFPRPRSASPKKRKTGGDDNETSGDSPAEMEQRGRKRARLSCGHGDVETEEPEASSGRSPRGHSRCSDESQSSSIVPTSSSATEQEVSLISCREASPSVTASVDGRQMKKDDYRTTGITDQDPCIQHFYADEDHHERLRRKELYRRRPRHNPELYCCDYDRHRDAVWAALKGEGPWDA
ncbi:MAG: hypothetical protein LQ348_003796, partial [Seirophora lacunosa]